MSPAVKTALSLAGVALIAAVAVGLAGKGGRALVRTGEEGATVWFYDLSERELYEVPRETVPPHQGIGGRRGDGVRAVVVAFPGERGDANKRRIAYLETYTPELKGVLEELRRARLAGKAFAGPVPARDSDLFRTNSLVKGPGESDWHTIKSSERKRAMMEWRSWTGPEGQAPVVCAP